MSEFCNCDGGTQSKKEGGLCLCYQSGEGSLPQKVTFEQRALGSEGQRHSGELGRVFQVKETRAKAQWSAAHRLLEEQHGAGGLEQSGRQRVAGDEVGEIAGTGNAALEPRLCSLSE